MGSSKFNLSKIGTGLMNDSSKAVGSSFRIVNLSLDDLVSHPLNDDIYPFEDISTLKLLIENEGIDQNLLVAPMPAPADPEELEERARKDVLSMYPEASKEELEQYLRIELRDAQILNKCYMDNPGKYLILSGNRRYQSYLELRDENPGIATYEFVPCKIIDDPEQAKTGYVSRLISSNSSGRQMSDYILLQQYEYLDRLTRKMKASGQRLGTSKRAYIAKVLQLSETQVQRIRSVSENLLPELKEKGGTAGLSISKAADIASRPIEEQEKILAEIICPPKVSPASPLVEPAPEQAAELVTEDLMPVFSSIDNIKSLLSSPVSVSATTKQDMAATIKKIEKLTKKLYQQIEKATQEVGD